MRRRLAARLLHELDAHGVALLAAASVAARALALRCVGNANVWLARGWRGARGGWCGRGQGMNGGAWGGGSGGRAGGAGAAGGGVEAVVVVEEVKVRGWCT